MLTCPFSLLVLAFRSGLLVRVEVDVREQVFLVVVGDDVELASGLSQALEEAFCVVSLCGVVFL